MGLFTRKTKQILGLDISSTHIKLVELSRLSSGYQLESFAVRPLPSGAAVEKNIQDIDVVSDTIRQAVVSARCKTKDTVVAVAGSAVITKVINMPVGLSDDELESQIIIDADQHIPFPLDEVAIDFEVLGQENEESGQMQVLLAACRRENVDLRTAVLEQAGLVPKIVDIEAYALERTAPYLIDDWEMGEDQLVAVIDIGATMSTLSVWRDQQTIYTREQLFGGQHLTENIQRRYGLSLQEAETSKLQGGLPDDYEAEVLEPFLDVVVQQITRSLQFFYSSSDYNQVDHIILAGGVANMEGLVQLVQQRLEILTTVATPLSEMSMGSRVNKHLLSSIEPALVVATGLALRGFV